MQDNRESQSSPYDLMALGASGFAGKYVIKEALKYLNTPSSPLKSIGLAGRSPARLTQALQWAAHPDPPPSFPILTVDTADPFSLCRLCSQTKLILNCIGPFRLHGKTIVAACADTGYSHKIAVPFPPKGPMIDHQKDFGLWAVKLPSADSVDVRRTPATLTENPGVLPGVRKILSGF